MRVSRILVLLPAAFALGACSTASLRDPVPDAAKASISSTEVVIPVRQSEIYVFVPPTNANAGGAGGLLGAVLVAAIDAGIDSVRTSKAETAVKPLRDAIVDYNFDDTLQRDLKTSLSQLTWLHVANTRVIKEVSDKSFDDALTASKADAVLFTAADYQLSNDAVFLTVTVSVDLFGNDDALRALKPKPASGPKTALVSALYRNRFTFVARVPNATQDRDANIASWSAQNGAATRAALKMATAKIAMMIATDMAAGPLPADIPTSGTLNGVPMQVVGSDADGEIVRHKTGDMEYAASTAILP